MRIAVLWIPLVLGCTKPPPPEPPAEVVHPDPPEAQPVPPPPEPYVDCCVCQLWGVTGPATDWEPPLRPEACEAVLAEEPCASSICAPPP